MGRLLTTFITEPDNSSSAVFVAIVLLLLTIRYEVVKNHSWRLPEQKHILFMGAAHIVHGIDDSMLEEAINVVSPSERYMYTYIKLKNIIAENPQVDTVFMELAATDLWEDTDYKYHTPNEQSHYVKNYWPLFDEDNWRVFKNEPFQVMGVVVSSITSLRETGQTSWWKGLGGYELKKSVIDPNKKLELKNYVPNSGHAVNYEYLHRIIGLCMSNGIKLYFLDAPVYRIEDIYDVVYFQEAYERNFSEIEFLDYSEWSIPMDERGDGSHLNDKGAKRFTNEIKNRFNLK
ncbi:MAG: hypothetical protein J6M30_04375 [Bacteroidales bacterium]|nr:hypothetical protein [Bacteroidales bacterium]